MYDRIKKSKIISLKYFEEHSEKKDEVLKACYAYDTDLHFSNDPVCHNFPGVLRLSKCVWCGRSRELVRWDDLPYECLKRPNNIPEIKDVIKDEELKYFKLLNTAKTNIPKILKKLGGNIDGNILSILHNTHGYEPEVVATIVEVPSDMLNSYEVAKEIEKEKSKSAHKTEIISVKL